MTRTEARELAFYIVFEHSFSGESVEDIIENSTLARDINVPSFSRELSKGVIDNITAIDEKITAHSKGWSVERISKVSLAVLRVSIYEMLFSEDVPVSVAINEAVNLCKTYAGEDEYVFVNGILGAVARANDTQGE